MLSLSLSLSRSCLYVWQVEALPMLASRGWGGANCNDSKTFDLLQLYLFHGWQENVFLFFSFWLSTQGVKRFLFSLTHNYKRNIFY
jgi:hypothetical protein